MKKINLILVLIVAALTLFFVLRFPSTKVYEDTGNNAFSQKAPILEEVFTLSGKSLLPEMVMAASDNSNTTEELTVYNNNLALVKETRAIPLVRGINNIQFQDVASQIKPETVDVRSLTDPEMDVLEQNYEYDLISNDKLAERYIGKDITVETDNQSYTGKLLKYSGGLILDTGQGIVSITNYKAIRFPSLPQGLITKPSLLWRLGTTKEGNHDIQLSYLTSGMSWNADYVAVYDGSKTDLSSWVTIDNKAGTDFPNTKLKLIAGDVHTVSPAPSYMDYYGATASGMAEKGVSGASQFQEQSFFEYHLYTLNTPTSIKNNEAKQIRFFSAKGVPVTKEYVFEQQQRYYYYGYEQNNNKVKTMISMKNNEANGLGMPLPKGTVRVYKQDAAGQEFIGEDTIDYTAKDGTVRIYVGDAADLTGQRTQTDYQRISDNVYTQSFNITLENQKTEDVRVIVKENIYGSWTVTQATHDYTKKDAYTIEFNVAVPKGGKTTIVYTVLNRY